MDLLELPPVELLDEWLELDPSIPEGLRWKKTRGGIPAGSPAGSWQERYFRLQFNRVFYLNHRIIYQLANPTADISKVGIDHRDGQTTHNASTNLRPASPVTQAMNRKKRADNSSGDTGVRFCPHRQRWVTQWIDEDGNRCNKTFPIKRFGDDAQRLAIEYRNRKLAGLSGYTTRHGK